MLHIAVHLHGSHADGLHGGHRCCRAAHVRTAATLAGTEMPAAMACLLGSCSRVDRMRHIQAQAHVAELWPPCAKTVRTHRRARRKLDDVRDAVLVRPLDRRRG